MTDRPLTDKEQRVAEAFETARPGLGVIAKASILNNEVTGWAEIIAETPENELAVGDGTASNSFAYRRICG